MAVQQQRVVFCFAAPCWPIAPARLNQIVPNIWNASVIADINGERKAPPHKSPFKKIRGCRKNCEQPL
jgi:hypothetical protein